MNTLRHQILGLASTATGPATSTAEGDENAERRTSLLCLNPPVVRL
jgi:hypothetical protein